MAPTAPSSKDRDGFWGKPTSTLDWCEENYVDSHYIAEFWNTWSNLAIILPPIIAVVYFTKYSQVETRYYMACLATFVVGIGSWCFHMTLLYEMQLMDELPMLYSASICFYCIYQTKSKPHQANWALITGLTFYAIVVSIVYIIIKDPIIHQVAYGSSFLLIIFMGLYFVKEHEQSRYLFYYSFFMALVAFIIWNTDTIFCDKIRALRDSLPFPVSVLTQGHMWWHVLSGLGVHVHLMFSLHLRTSFLKCSPQIKHVASLPYISLPGATKKATDDNRNHFH